MNQLTGNAMVVEGTSDWASTAQAHLSSLGFTPHVVSDLDEAQAQLQELSPTVLLCDWLPADHEGSNSACERIIATKPGIIVIRVCPQAELPANDATPGHAYLELGPWVIKIAQLSDALRLGAQFAEAEAQ